MVLDPIELVAVKETVKVPGPEKVCDGFCKVEVLEPEVGSPKFHNQLVGPFCERSVKVTVGEQVVVAEAENSAVGALVFWITVMR